MQNMNEGAMPPPPPASDGTQGGMYNPVLENLIEMALADGVLTEKEKQVLFKRAQAQGIDLDEFEMVLDAKLFERKKNGNQVNANAVAGSTNSAPRSSKCGDVRKCPACGAMIGTFMMACPDCGYEFVGVGANSFVERFAKGLQEAVSNFEKAEDQREIRNRTKSNAGGLVGQLQGLMDMQNSVSDSTGALRNAKQQQVEAQYVKTAVLPRAKEDCIEMLNYLLPKIKVSGANRATSEWRKYYLAVLDKLEMGASRDAELTQLIAYYRKQFEVSSWDRYRLWWSGLSQPIKVLIGVVIFYLVLGLICAVMALVAL